MNTKIDLLHKRPYIFFYIANILGFLSLFYIDLKSGVIISIISIGVLLIQANQLGKLFRNSNSILFLIFLIFEILGFVNYFFIGYSREVFFDHPEIILHTFNYILIPQFIFFISGFLVSQDTEKIEYNIKKILYANAFLLCIGLYFYIFKPNIYIEYIKRIHPEEFAMFHSFVPRMQSYFNSMVIGNISAVSFLLSIRYFKTSVTKIFLLVFFLLSTFLSMQRSAWISLPFALLLFYFNKGAKIPIRTKLNLTKIIFGIVSLVLISSTIYYIINYNTFFVEFITKRFSILLSGPAERFDQWKIGLNIVKEYPFGIGTGLLTHKAFNLNLPYAIPDGNYFRILGEIGYLGLISFITLLSFSGYLSILKKEYILFSALIIYFIQAIGTNVFDLFYSGFLFWFLIGITFGCRTKK